MIAKESAPSSLGMNTTAAVRQTGLSISRRYRGTIGSLGKTLSYLPSSVRMGLSWHAAEEVLMECPILPEPPMATPRVSHFMYADNQLASGRTNIAAQSSRRSTYACLHAAAVDAAQGHVTSCKATNQNATNRNATGRTHKQHWEIATGHAVESSMP